MPTIRFGIQTPQEGATYETLATHWREADALGFDSIWLNDHDVIVDGDPARARARLERAATAWGMTPAQMEGRALVGTPERVIERVREYVAVGVTHFIGLFGRVEDLRGTRLFAEQVLPAFR